MRLSALASSKRRCRPFLTPLLPDSTRSDVPESTVGTVAAEFDPAAMVQRFRERAQAVRNRGVPPLEGDARRQYIQRMSLDYQDFAMLADATADVEDGVLVLRVDLRPEQAKKES